MEFYAPHFFGVPFIGFLLTLFAGALIGRWLAWRRMRRCLAAGGNPRGRCGRRRDEPASQASAAPPADGAAGGDAG